MVLKSKGPRKRTRSKFRGPKKLTVNRSLQKMEPGQSVVVNVSSNALKGMPFRRFHGLTGKVLEQRGRSYVVEITDGNKKKKIAARPEHLRAL